MAKIADYTVKGASGRAYTFGVYDYNSTWKEVAAVYLVTKRSVAAGKGTHEHIYVGQTENLNERFSGHHKEECFMGRNANCLCILMVDSEDDRLAIESDILDGGVWPCND